MQQQHIIRDRFELAKNTISYYAHILLVKFMTNLLAPEYIILWQLGSHA